MVLKKISVKRNEIIDVKRNILIASISLTVGIIIFIIAYLGMRGGFSLGELNQPILSWMVSHRDLTVTTVAKITTTIANPLVFAIIVISFASIWMYKTKEIWRPVLLTGSVAIAALTSMVLKLVIMDARPPQVDMVPLFETDFSFPSGHTIGMAAFLFVLGYLIYSRHFSFSRLWIWATAALFGTSIIALSRLYLGYHWLTDVAASLGLSLIILAVVIFIDLSVIQHNNPKKHISR